MNKQTVIVSGGALDEELTLNILRSEETEIIVGVDRGLGFLYDHKIKPDYIVGDFDSVQEEIVQYYRENTDVPIRAYNPVKDASDTEIAMRLCLGLRRRKIILLGGTGNRMDHAWANVQILKIAADAGVEAVIMDPWNKIRLISGNTILKKEEAYGKYFSLFPLGQTVVDFSISGAKYPLSHHTLTPWDSLCVSNEFAEDEVDITFPIGDVILMETRD